LQGIVTMVCAALAPLLVGPVSDGLSHLRNGLVLAVVCTAVPSILLSTWLLHWCEVEGFQQTVDNAARVDALRAFAGNQASS
jgi:NhaP-type Na+/H+ or K+/H+ antiporter